MFRAPASEARLPQPGQIWGQKYRILGSVGSGAMGHVLAAEHLLLDRRVALKFIQGDRAASSERFVREARAAQALTSDHVVRVFDVATEGDVPYLVMELLDGVDLACLLRARSRLPAREAVDYLLQACAGVAEAHASGIVHRDLKPSNLFRTERASGQPLIKVLDFGISKELTRIDLELTSPRSLLGSPFYMSPEQLRNAQRVDERTDVWSLAVTLHTLLTGEPPFRGDTIAEVSIAIATDRPRSLSQAAPDAPLELEDALVRALHKAPERRTATVVALAEDLAPFASSEGILTLQKMKGQFRPPSVRRPAATDRRVTDADAQRSGPSPAPSSEPALDLTDADGERVVPSFARAAATPVTSLESPIRRGLARRLAWFGAAALIASTVAAALGLRWSVRGSPEPAQPALQVEATDAIGPRSREPQRMAIQTATETATPEPSHPAVSARASPEPRTAGSMAVQESRTAADRPTPTRPSTAVEPGRKLPRPSAPRGSVAEVRSPVQPGVDIDGMPIVE